MLELKNYQEEKIDELLCKSINLLNRGSKSKSIVFKSPTGSGKTTMVAEMIKRLSQHHNYQGKVAFIWTAPRDVLTSQSKKSLTNYYKTCNSLKCSNFFDLKENKISPSEILFINWEKINKKTNIIIEENERNFYLSKVIANTIDQGTKIILIVDEAHHTATTPATKQIIEDIHPDITINVSATPSIQNFDEFVSVDIEDVKEEGMIKKSIIFNQGFGNQDTGEAISSNASEESNLSILKIALKKREEIQKIFLKKKKNINPLLLIQLPREKKSDPISFKIKEDIIDWLKSEFSITTENGKLAIYLSEKKELLANIEKQDNPVEVMLFKEGIALGWDCPRAHILLAFREMKSLRFSTQTVGRIMRMPEPKVGHYLEEALDNAFFYTNLDKVKKPKESFFEGYISTSLSKKVGKVDLNLVSFHRLRNRAKTRLSFQFNDLFLKEAEKQNLKNRLNKNPGSVSKNFLMEINILNIDRIEEGDFDEYDISIENPRDLQKFFDSYVIESLLPEFTPQERSITRLKQAIYKFFENSLKMNLIEHDLKIFQIVLNEQNQKKFNNVILKTKEIYQKLSEELEELIIRNENWTIPETIHYSREVMELPVKKSIMQPFFYSDNNLNTNERKFIDYLDSSEKVKFWFRNGDSDRTYFSLPYGKKGSNKLFYPDFIVIFKDKTVGFFDTKFGSTISESMLDGKSDALCDFVNNNDKFIGGIISNTKKNYSGLWKIFRKKSKYFQIDSFDNWDDINF